MSNVGHISLETLKSVCVKTVSLILNFGCLNITCYVIYKKQWGEIKWACVTRGESHMILQSMCVARSDERLATLCLNYHNAYGHQTRKLGHLQWGAPTHKFRWSFNLKIWWSHMANKICFISISIRQMRPPGIEWWLLTVYRGKLPPIKSNNSLKTKSVQVTEKNKNIISPLP